MCVNREIEGTAWLLAPARGALPKACALFYACLQLLVCCNP
jgi:hypothetical protein